MMRIARAVGATLLLAGCTIYSFAADVSLTWTAPTQNTDGSALTDLASYEIHAGCNQSGQYDRFDIVEAPALAHTVTGLPESGTCYFAAKAINAQGVASVFSGEVERVLGDGLPGPIENLVVTWKESTGVITIPWTKQPPADTPIDFTNPLSQGLVGAWAGGGVGMPDLCGNGYDTDDSGGSPQFGYDDWGRYWLSDGTNAGVLAFDSNKIPTGSLAGVSGLTALAVAYTPSAAGAFSNFIATKVNDAYATNRGWGFKFELFNNTGKIGFTKHHAGDVASSIDSPIDRRYVAMAAWDGVTNDISVRFGDTGELQTDSFAQTVGTNDPINGYIIGAELRRNFFAVDGVIPSGSKIYFTGIWNRKLTAGERRSLEINPWQIFVPQQVPVSFIIDVGGVATPHYPFGLALAGPFRGPIG